LRLIATDCVPHQARQREEARRASQSAVTKLEVEDEDEAALLEGFSRGYKVRSTEYHRVPQSVPQCHRVPQSVPEYP